MIRNVIKQDFLLIEPTLDKSQKDQGLNDASIKAILDTVNATAEQIEELKKEDFSDEEIKEVMKLVHKDEVKFKAAKAQVSHERDDDQKVRGVRAEGPWASSNH